MNVRATKGSVAAAVMMCALAPIITACGGSGEDEAAAAAQDFATALEHQDGKAACAKVAPKHQDECDFGFKKYDVKYDFDKVEKAVVEGDRALAALTGKFCVMDHCQKINDPSRGMPSDSVSFDKACKQAVNGEGPKKSAALALIKVDGTWYVNGD